MGGALTYTNNLATSLGVEPSQVQIVDITEGSVIVTSDIVVSENQSVADLRSQITTATQAEGGLSLGLPVNYIETKTP